MLHSVLTERLHNRYKIFNRFDDLYHKLNDNGSRLTDVRVLIR